MAANLIGAAALGLLIRGQHISDLRAERRRVARINSRIAAERDPGRRAAWRAIRDRDSEGEQW
ncbi:hypothetical protein AB0451_03530 [Streptomyces sp. NPDC052000]|uniref:hypothetical protein n=1 Tax=Streptomyces sp. NPDC052000 TaxID=3155676 RepID=UPI00344C94A7